jgi:hypothetical protein
MAPVTPEAGAFLAREPEDVAEAGDGRAGRIWTRPVQADVRIAADWDNLQEMRYI